VPADRLDSDPDIGSHERGLASIEPPIHSGAELVALAERFNYGVFLGALGFIALSTLMALAFLPLRSSADHGKPPLPAVAAAILVLVLAALAAWRASDVDRLLRRRPALEFVPVLIAAALLSVASPLRNELWWSACAILMALALRISLRRALLYSLVVLLANLIAHASANDWADTSPRGIIGLWIGLPFWTAMAAIVPQRMASHILRLNAERTRPRRSVRRVPAGSPDGSDVAPRRDDGRTTDANGSVPSSDRPTTGLDAPPTTGSARMSRLTSRQLEVVVLLADGQRYEQIGACLAITPGQVYRHARNAIVRLGLENVNQLVAIAVAEGVARPSAPEQEGEDNMAPPKTAS
jgi:DNA-binding CsgD family transcriptional regulator